MTAYYNEIDPAAAQWLRNLIEAGHIAPGIVDERSIEDVYPSDLRGFTQCHFFAGIGVWSHALRSSGWSDDRPVWTGSCPCQPFSAAGKGAGFDDERHLWPAFQHLIKECKPPVVFGEQVASKDSDPWIDLVCTDLEALGYAFGAIPFPSAGVGAPHIRDRLYWVGHASGTGLERHTGHGGAARWQGQSGPVTASGVSGGLGNADSDGAGRDGGAVSRQITGQDREHVSFNAHTSSGNGGVADTDNKQPQGSTGERARVGEFGWEGIAGGLADSDSHGCESRHGVRLHGSEHDAQHGSSSGIKRPGPTNGFWSAADWLGCRDGKWRPVEPGTFPLANGAPSRVVRLRAYGNAINSLAAQTFIQSVMEAA